MLKFKLLAFLLFIAATLQVAAQSKTITTVATPEAAGFSSERLKRLDAAMADWTAQGAMNGGVALIIHDGKIAYYKGAGYNNMETKEPMFKDGIFRIASQTKAITAVATMILFEEGKLLLTDPVSKYIPSFKKQSVLAKFNPADSTYTTIPAAREITIKDLLTHTSGLGYAQIGSKEATAIYAKNNITAGIGVSNETLLSAMTRLGKLPLMHQPGLQFTYGLNMDVMGCIVEIVSGMPLDRFFNTHIFEPLGMKDSYFTIPKAKAGKLVNIYTEANGSLQRVTSPIANFPLAGNTYYSGGSSLSSSIYDYAIFLQMLLNGGEYNGARILGRNTVRMMTTNQIGDLILRENKFGLGFEIVTERGSAKVPANIGTFSWSGAFATNYWVDPKEKLVMLFYRQLQSTTHTDLVEKFRAITYGALNN
jgi:CubicO group peptidase (beta-lactamase class C family)